MSTSSDAEDDGGGVGPAGPVAEAVGDLVEKSVGSGGDAANTETASDGDVTRSAAEMMRDAVPEVTESGEETGAWVAGPPRDTTEGS